MRSSDLVSITTGTVELGVGAEAVALAAGASTPPVTSLGGAAVVALGARAAAGALSIDRCCCSIASRTALCTLLVQSQSMGFGLGVGFANHPTPAATATLASHNSGNSALRLRI